MSSTVADLNADGVVDGADPGTLLNAWADCAAASLFVGDDASAAVLCVLHAGGTRVIAPRSAGFSHVDIGEAQRLGLSVLRVPECSFHAVAEHAVALMMAVCSWPSAASSRSGSRSR